MGQARWLNGKIDVSINSVAITPARGNVGLAIRNDTRAAEDDGHRGDH
jgi:hypothetical protein